MPKTKNKTKPTLVIDLDKNPVARKETLVKAIAALRKANRKVENAMGVCIHDIGVENRIPMEHTCYEINKAADHLDYIARYYYG